MPTPLFDDSYEQPHKKVEARADAMIQFWPPNNVGVFHRDPLLSPLRVSSSAMVLRGRTKKLEQEVIGVTQLNAK